MEGWLKGARAYREAHAGEIIGELCQFVRIPNNVYLSEQIQQNARALQAMLERRGAAVELWPTESGRPVVFAELPAAGAGQTLLIYGHYDGVPAEPGDWHSDPYEPVLRTGLPAGVGADWSTIPLPADGRFADDWRLFGRSIADSKNGIIAVLTAIDALRAQGAGPDVNLKFCFDGEEEQESPGLGAVIAAHKERLAADLMISASGETHQSGLPTVMFGVRGILTLDLTIYTSTVELHSGHFGNFAPSAVFQLAHLLATMKNQDGLITIDGFYDEVLPLTETEQAALSAIPPIEGKLQEQFGIALPEVPGRPLQELVNMPTLNVRGISGGFVGEAARNIVPRMARADFDIRLVKGMDPDRTLACLIAHIERQGWKVLDHEPSREELLAFGRVACLVKQGGFPATRTPMDSPMGRYLVEAVERAVAEPVVVAPTDGGSLMMHRFEEAGIPVVELPTSNFDCNQHTHDENLQVKYLFRAIDIFVSVFSGQGLPAMR